jgi:predicted dehydrogenase
VLVEKPLCLDPADADRVVAAAGDRVVQVGYMKRFDPAYEALLDDLPGGLLHVVSALRRCSSLSACATPRRSGGATASPHENR